MRCRVGIPETYRTRCSLVQASQQCVCPSLCPTHTTIVTESEGRNSTEKTGLAASHLRTRQGVKAARGEPFNCNQRSDGKLIFHVVRKGRLLEILTNARLRS